MKLQWGKIVRNDSKVVSGCANFALHTHLSDPINLLWLSTQTKKVY